MVQNFPGPWELRIEYTTLFGAVPLIHTQRLNVDLTTVPLPGTDFADIDAKTRGGVLTPTLESAVDNWLTQVAERFSTTTTFGIVELWSYVPLTFDATFISAFTSVVTAGAHLNPTIVAAQEIYTFRTTEGGVVRISLIEAVAPADQPKSFPIGNISVDNIAAFITSPSNWILGRDTSYPFAGMRFLPGQNEKTFRQRFR